MAAVKILVVDDSPTMRRIIINILRRLGYVDVTEAADGLDAIARMKQDAFDLVITEWNMPGMDGVTLAGVIRQSPMFHHIPIVMVSARSVREDIVTAVRAGVNSYVVKPFSPETLKDKIEQILAKP